MSGKCARKARRFPNDFQCTVDSRRMTAATRRPPPDGFRHDGFRDKLSHRRRRRPIGQAAEWRVHASVGHRRSHRSSQIGAGEGTGRQLRQAAASSPCDRSLRAKLVACFGDIGFLETRGPIALDRSSNSQMGSPTPSPNLPPSENNSPKLLNQFRQPATPGSKSPGRRESMPPPRPRHGLLRLRLAMTAGEYGALILLSVLVPGSSTREALAMTVENRT